MACLVTDCGVFNRAVFGLCVAANLYTCLPGNVYETGNAFNHNETHRKADKAYYDAKGKAMPAAADQSAAAVRAVQAGIKSELLAGVFPF